MSIFNFRRGRPANAKASAKGAAASKTAPESVEVVRKRARQRLIGSAVLVLLGVIGFPLLFETQPRPVAIDIPIEIPSRTAVKPGSLIPPVLRNGQAESAQPTVAAVAAVAASTAAPSEPVPPAASLQDKEALVEAKPKAAEPVPAKAAPEATSASAPSPSPAPELAGETRVIVQVGAFTDEARVREARAKLEKAGLKTYTQVAETKEGKRIRVRVGPFASKAEAEKVVAKIKALNLPATILVL